MITAQPFVSSVFLLNLSTLCIWWFTYASIHTLSTGLLQCYAD